jgi:hypothetical protein
LIRIGLLDTELSPVETPNYTASEIAHPMNSFVAASCPFIILKETEALGVREGQKLQQAAHFK